MYKVWLLTLGPGVETQRRVGQLDGRVAALDVPLLFWFVVQGLTKDREKQTSVRRNLKEGGKGAEAGDLHYDGAPVGGRLWHDDELRVDGGCDVHFAVARGDRLG